MFSRVIDVAVTTNFQSVWALLSPYLLENPASPYTNPEQEHSHMEINTYNTRLCIGLFMNILQHQIFAQRVYRSVSRRVTKDQRYYYKNTDVIILI